MPIAGRLARTRKLTVDWSAVKRDYDAARLSVHAIGEKHACAHSTIANYASRHGWGPKPSVHSPDGNHSRLTSPSSR
jgi:hypothetical protein